MFTNVETIIGNKIEIKKIFPSTIPARLAAVVQWKLKVCTSMKTSNTLEKNEADFYLHIQEPKAFKQELEINQQTSSLIQSCMIWKGRKQ
jgi:hypothetical protein